MSTMHPQSLLEEALSGNEQAVAELLETYRNYLLMLAEMQVNRSLQRKLDAADLVQETYLAACRDFEGFRGRTEQELLAWLRTILANIAGKTVRRYKGTQARDINREQSVADRFDQSAAGLSRLVAPISTPSKGVVRREAAVLLADRLAELPEHYRHAIILYHLEGLTIAQVAERIERTPDATNSLLARALIKLRALMKGAA